MAAVINQKTESSLEKKKNRAWIKMNSAQERKAQALSGRVFQTRAKKMKST